MFNIFKMKFSSESIISPFKGRLINIEDVPDPVFSGKMVGDGVAVEPEEGIVYSPVNGEIIQLFPTKHAVGIISSGGLEILIHIGMDTVEMKGDGFESFVEEGQKVKAGDKLIMFDIDKIKENHSIISPVIITNMEAVDKIKKKESGTTVEGGKTEIMKINLK
ncbi:PTS sugar transporter subunit IIA [Thermoanaerobacterium thermosaccharolyticum]|uniref:PTS system IIA component, Glc family n=1 Tax=Thermoanaerobacterium thermosaccharolyticum M0795 TaxID=698948 RepID=L0IK51_THETR|nr:PTS glucose transporter subunit IIA [Thermoanaerobacterium thermosaccharolyticum]AGB19880.1 PTS system IIA component, Glc family [Thermoanaerobacterium thermosaccharolyticum M0795]